MVMEDKIMVDKTMEEKLIEKIMVGEKIIVDVGLKIINRTD